jgi:SNF2 family DNA or RNA helicase
MASPTNEHKTVLLLSPHRLLSDYQVLESLHITKSKTGTEFKDFELLPAEINSYYYRLPQQAKDTLPKFNKAAVAGFQDEIKKKFSTQKTGVNYNTYYQQVMKRKMHELLENLKPYATMVSWYHRLKSGNARFVTGPCSFSSYKPQLHFEVRQHENLLQLHTIIRVNGIEYPYDEFKRVLFLLQSKNEYFLLSMKDYQTLDWLQHNDPAIYAAQPVEFAHKILATLENDYVVNRNNLLPKVEINVKPQNRVLLSELNQKFLVFTPQWWYDGFILEAPWKESFETTKNGETYLIKRDRANETAFLSMLESLHEKFSNQINGYYYLTFDEAQKKQWFHKIYHQLLSDDIQLIGMDMLQHFRYSSQKISFKSEIIKKENNAITLKVAITFGNEEVALSEIQKLLMAGQRSVLLKDQSIGIIHDEWQQQYGTILRHGRVSGNELRVPKWFAFSEDENSGSAPILKVVLKKSWQEKWQHWQENPKQLYPLPSIITATLRPYQVKGFEWMMLLAEADAGACLADDMGLGKTLQTICFIASKVQEDPSVKHLVVCPASLIYNWQQEFAKFAPGIKTFVHHGSARSEDLANEDCQVVITTYGTLRSEIENMSNLKFGLVVLDESHNIKNPTALITRAVAQLQAHTRIALSGTPIMNNTFDLFAQLNFILPGFFGNREFFKREFADNIDRKQDPEKMMALKKLTEPFILRRTKYQVAADLPNKTEIIMWCSMGTAQKALYDEIKTTIRANIFLNIKNDGLNKSKLAVLQGMLKLRQLCNSPLLLPPEEQSGCTDSVKTELLMNELLNNLKDHKVLVFSQFTSMLNLLAKTCGEEGIAYYHFDGQTPPAKRAELVARFQEEGDTTNVFLISLKAGNTGLNLTAASYVFLFDPWWNTAVQQQAIDRAHRIGQTKNVFAYKMICKDTIEEKIIALQERKKKLADDLITEDEGFVKSLSVDEIEYLFS